jgi:MFS family permease
MDQETAIKPPPLWQNRDYLLLWLGQAISSIGTGMSQFAFPLLVLTLTGSFADAGLAGALGQLPYLLLSLPAGALVDRWPRKRVMITCTLCLVACLASIPLALFSGHLTILQIYVVAFVMGTLFLFYGLAELGALTHMVPRTQLTTAVAQNEAVYSTVQLLSPSLGGLLLSRALALPFLADVLSYFVLLGSLLGIRSSLDGEHERQTQHILADIREGIHWLWNHPVMRFLAFLSGYLYVTMNGSVLLVYAIARQQHIALALVGLLLGVGGAGNIVGTLLSPLVQRRLRFGWALTSMLLLFVLFWPLYALASTPPLLGLVIALLAVIDSIASIPSDSYRLAAVPNALQGRVGSIYRLIIFGSLIVGQELIGLSLDHFGILITIAWLWLGLLLFALLALLLPSVRQASFPLEITPSPPTPASIPTTNNPPETE